MSQRWRQNEIYLSVHYKTITQRVSSRTLIWWLKCCSIKMLIVHCLLKKKKSHPMDLTKQIDKIFPIGNVLQWLTCYWHSFIPLTVMSDSTSCGGGKDAGLLQRGQMVDQANKTTTETPETRPSQRTIKGRWWTNVIEEKNVGCKNDHDWTSLKALLKSNQRISVVELVLVFNSESTSISTHTRWGEPIGTKQLWSPKKTTYLCDQLEKKDFHLLRSMKTRRRSRGLMSTDVPCSRVMGTCGLEE